MRWQLLLGLLLLALAACGTEGGTAEPLRVTLRSLPTAYVGERYDVRVPASGGIRPYHYELEGDLPEGVQFAAGRFSGTPRKKGSFKLNLAVSDAALSTRTVNFTLRVTDPPPPQLSVKQPGSATDSPFIAVFKLNERPTTALRLHLDLKNLTPDLESFSASDDLLYVLRYNAEKHTLDLDGAFTGVVKGLEVFRIKLTPAEKLLPRLKPVVQFFNAKGEPYTPNPPKRPPDKGEYAFDDLRTLAAHWPGPKPALKAPPKKETAKPDEKAAPPAAKKPPADEPQKSAGSPEPAKPKEKPAPLPGDLNHDGKVGPDDLAQLRASYAFNPGGKLTPPQESVEKKAPPAGDEQQKTGSQKPQPKQQP